MRRAVGLLLLAAASLLLAACVSSGPSVGKAEPAGRFAGGPRLAFDQNVVDYGNVAFGQEVSATFQMKNVGDRPLTIKNVDLKTVEGC